MSWKLYCKISMSALAGIDVMNLDKKNGHPVSWWPRFSRRKMAFHETPDFGAEIVT